MILLKEILISKANKHRFWKKYYEEIAKDFDGRVNYEDLVKRFNGVQQTIKKDFFSFSTLRSLIDAIKDAEEKVAASKEKKKVRSRDVDKLYNDDEWLVLRPKTEETSCIFGKNTAWCISATTSQNHFDSYKENDAVHVFIISKKHPTLKFAATVYLYEGKYLFDLRNSADDDLLTDKEQQYLPASAGKIFDMAGYTYRIDLQDSDEAPTVERMTNLMKHGLGGAVPPGLIDITAKYLYTTAIKDSGKDRAANNLTEDFDVLKDQSTQNRLMCVPKNLDTMQISVNIDYEGIFADLFEHLAANKVHTLVLIRTNQNPIHYTWYFYTDSSEFGWIYGNHASIYSDTFEEKKEYYVEVHPKNTMLELLTNDDLRAYRAFVKTLGLNGEEMSTDALKKLWNREENGTSLRSLYYHMCFGSDNPGDWLKSAMKSVEQDQSLLRGINQSQIEQEIFFLFKMSYMISGSLALFNTNRHTFDECRNTLFALLENQSVKDKLENVYRLYTMTKLANPIWKKYRNDFTGESHRTDRD